jgi:UDP-N-acetylmuramate--alanine ligase
MASLLDYSHFYLVGIKGVAMASLAQCLVDAGKKVKGSDVPEAFVTQAILDRLQIPIETTFTAELPAETECLVHTAAHQGRMNPQVQAALKQGLPVFSQAEAIASLFNQKKGVAVCGVGGKSSTSAMVTWILDKTGREPSFSVGVGNIPGLEKTGQWRPASEYFVAEADEYVIDPTAPSRGEPLTPRFLYLKPFITICTNLKFDHPDVYRDFAHTQATYQAFFEQIKDQGMLVVNADDQPLVELATKVSQAKGYGLVTFGRNEQATISLKAFSASAGQTETRFSYQGQTHTLKLLLPGEYNAFNALAAITATQALGVPVTAAIQALATFRSTMRRAEFIGEKAGVRYYDDYAHHPNEVKSVIHAFKQWYPNQKVVAAFQSHTFSRTKALFNDFVQAFEEADEVVMIDIFASAREAYDESVSSDLLCEAIKKKYPKLAVSNVHTIAKLAEYCQTQLQPGDVLLTIGAGDIYHVHELIT